MAEQKKYAGLDTLRTFLDNLKTTFSSLSHSHTLSDITDYTVDGELSSTSTNPVQNKVLNAEFEAISQAMIAYDAALEDKANVEHNHDDKYYTETEIDTKLAEVDGKLEQKVNTSTLENYYTGTEVDNLLSSKSDSTHNHDSDYDTKGAASEALTSANAYTDTAVANLASTTVVDNKISAHDTNAEAHNDIRDLITGLNEQLELFLDVDDTTKDQLSEVLALIEANKGTLESLTTSKINVSAIVDNLTTASTDKVLSANQGVVISGLISALSIELEALESTVNTHTHDDRYYTEAEINDQVSTINTSISNIVDGITTVAKASKDASGNVITTTYELKTDANSKLAEAKSYTDTEISEHNTSTSAHSDLFALKADANDLTSHINNKSNPHGVTLSQLGVTATAAELNKMDGVTATTAELNYVNGVTSNIQTQLDGKAASDHSHSNYVPTTRTVNSKVLSSNITLSASDVGADASGTASSAVSTHNSSSSAHSSLFAAKANVSDLDNYYTKAEIDSIELITVDDIDTIYNASISFINEVTF